MRERLKAFSLLYVEDDADIRRNIAEYLRHFFAAVHTADDAQSAMQAYRAHRPDALLLDIDLPGTDGLTLASKVRERDREIPILMLTAFTDTQKLLRATELRLLKYLVKPVDTDAFREALDMLADELLRCEGTLTRLDASIWWDHAGQRLYDRGKLVSLGEKERRLLALLISRRRTTVSFETIVAEVWDDGFARDVSVDSVKTLVSILRKKLPPDMLQSVYGQGYCLR